MPKFSFKFWGDDKIESPQTVLAAAAAAETLEGKYSGLQRMVEAVERAARLSVSRIAELIAATDFTKDGERLVKSIADGMLNQISAIEAASRQIGKAIRAGIPKSAKVSVSLTGAAKSPIQARAGGGNYAPGWLLTGEQGPELRYENKGGFIAHNQALKGMVSLASKAREMVQGIEFGGSGSFGQMAPITVPAIAPAQSGRGGQISFNPTYHIPITVGSADANSIEEMRAMIRAEMEEAQARMEVDGRRMLHD